MSAPSGGGCVCSWGVSVPRGAGAVCSGGLSLPGEVSAPGQVSAPEGMLMGRYPSMHSGRYPSPMWTDRGF